MNIGKAWTKDTEAKENKPKRSYISIKLDDVITEQYPVLKNCFLNLWYIPIDQRKNENSPHWDLTISVKKDLEKSKENNESNEIEEVFFQ